MSNSVNKIEWSYFSQNWKGIILRLFDASEASIELKGKVPKTWIDLLNSPNSETVKKLWIQAVPCLPKFTSYLSWAILDARIAETQFGFLLVYKLKDWNESINYYGDDEIYFEDGFMISGSPVENDIITAFEKESGMLPQELRNLWLVHGFIELRNYNYLASLDSKQQKLAHGPKLFRSLKDDYIEEQLLDCLGIANLSGETIPSLTRNVGSSTWANYIVNVSRLNSTTYNASKNNIDDMLSDWLFNEWPIHGGGIE